MDIQAKILLKIELGATPCQMNCSYSKYDFLYYTKQQTTVYISKNIHKKLVPGEHAALDTFSLDQS